MKALVAAAFGDTPKMEIQERAIPEVTEGKTLIRLHAATVNPLSNQIRHGGVPAATAPLVLSNDGSGIVEKSSQFTPGTRVAIFGGGDLGIKEDGLQQQYALVENKRIFPLPETIDLDAGAIMPVCFVTAYQALNRVGKAKPGQTILVAGATGSVGHALMQLALAVGAVPIAIVSQTGKVKQALDGGAKKVIDLSTEDLKTGVLAATDGEGVDLAFDPVGGEITGRLIQCLLPRGAVVSIGFAAGLSTNVDLVDLVVHEKQLLGYDLHLETDADVANAFNAVLEMAADGKIKPSLDGKFALADYEAAYERLASRKATGTILLEL